MPKKPAQKKSAALRSDEKSRIKTAAKVAVLSPATSVEQLATTLLTELHHKVQDWIISYLEKFTDPASLNLRAPLPKPLNKPNVIASLVEGFRQAIQDPAWHIDPTKFSLGGPELSDAIQEKPLSYLVQYVFLKAQRALRN
jgi:hypothetical protein